MLDVCIIGAGVSGLQCARAILKTGLDVVVLDRQQELGGVWAANYSGLRTTGPIAGTRLVYRASTGARGL